MSAIGTKRTWRVALHMSAFGGKADMLWERNVRFSLTSGHSPAEVICTPVPHADMSVLSRRSVYEFPILKNLVTARPRPAPARYDPPPRGWGAVGQAPARRDWDQNWDQFDWRREKNFN